MELAGLETGDLLSAISPGVLPLFFIHLYPLANAEI
jgi:hypothetical protein